MGLEDLMVHAVVLELEHGHVAVGGGAGEQAAGLVGRPGECVNGGRVQREVVDARPLRVSLPPDEDLAVVGGAREDIAVLGVRPGDRPDCSFVTMGCRC